MIVTESKRATTSLGYTVLLIAISEKGTTEPVERMNVFMSAAVPSWVAYSVTSFNTSLRSSSDGVTNTSIYLMLRVSTGCSKEPFFLLYRSLISLFETVIVESLIEE